MTTKPVNNAACDFLNDIFSVICIGRCGDVIDTESIDHSDTILYLPLPSPKEPSSPLLRTLEHPLNASTRLVNLNI